VRGSPGLPRHCRRGLQFPIRSIVTVQMARQATARCPLWVISGKARLEHLLSALPQIANIGRQCSPNNKASPRMLTAGPPEW
jgi:hypothetical protein